MLHHVKRELSSLALLNFAFKNGILAKPAKESLVIPNEDHQFSDYDSDVFCSSMFICRYYHLLKEFTNSHFSDLKLTKCNTVIFQIPKDKQAVNYLINQSFNKLPAGGQMIICGSKDDGIKSCIERASKLFGDPLKTVLSKSGTRVAVFQRKEAGEYLPETYISQGKVKDGEVVFKTKPGVFGWNKIDKGSLLLRKHISGLKGRVLDLGCGYGYLSYWARVLGADEVVAVDTSAAALEACRLNFKALDIHGEVVASDCTEELETKFDAVICNPPFHSGKDVFAALTDKFLKGCWNVLKEEGIAWFVVNEFISADKKAKDLFDVEEIVREGGFKVLKLTRRSI